MKIIKESNEFLSRNSCLGNGNGVICKLARFRPNLSLLCAFCKYPSNVGLTKNCFFQARHRLFCILKNKKEKKRKLHKDRTIYAMNYIASSCYGRNPWLYQ